MPKKLFEKGHKGFKYVDRNPDALCSYILRDGTRCGAWRAKNSAHPDRCPFHQGKVGGSSFLVRPWERLSIVYRKYVGPTLRQALEQELSKPRSEQIELYEELALLRALAADTVKAWNALSEGGHFTQAAAMGEIMKENFESIAKICNTISTIEARANDEVNVHTLNGLVAQITSMMYSVCGHDHEELARVFATRVRDELVIPAIEHKGTDITPDQAVIEMDNTVP